MAPMMSRRSLSARLLWLTAGFVLLAQVMIFIPAVGRERLDWLRNRITEAHIAALSVAASDGMVDDATRDELLRLSGTEAIRLTEPDRAVLALAPADQARADAFVDLTQEGWLEGIVEAFGTLVRRHGRLLAVSGPSPLRPDVTVQLLVRESALAADLRSFAWTIAVLSLAIAVVPALLVYFTLHWLLVRPMRRITGSIAAFRADPERTLPLDAASLRGRDEIAVAARELAAMQAELRAALWRNARLAALGTAVAKISHDLRGSLGTALLIADRLESSADPATRNAARTLAASVERASALIRGTLDFVREGPPPVTTRPTPLAPLLEEAGHAAPGLALDCDLPAGATVNADRAQMLRVLANLLRNAAEAGARRMTVTLEAEEGGVALLLGDDGPGLPEPIRTNLFRPFVAGGRRGGTGLGLAIVHDLMRAQGGDITLVDTGPDGTRFRLFLPGGDGRAPSAAASEAAQPAALRAL